jgi:SAM-dependent methyltransferase
MTKAIQGNNRLFKRLYHRLPKPPTTNFLFPGHETASPFSDLPENALVYDIGSKRMRGYNGWSLPRGGRIVTLDIDPESQPDIVADAHDLHMIPDNSADCVLSICVIEHCAKPWIVMDEIHRILKPGGKVFIGVPFMFPFHADPYDNWRVTYKGIDYLCERFEKIDSGFCRGPASCMTHLNIHFLALLLSFNSKALYGVLVDLFSWVFFWTKYLDRLLVNHPMSHVIHAGVFFYGRKH